MGIKQVPTSVVLKYFAKLGLVHKRTTASHFLYDYPDGHPGGRLLRPIPIHQFEKDVPLFHIHTILKTLDKPKSDFENWIKSQQKGGKSSKKPIQPKSDHKKDRESNSDES